MLFRQGDAVPAGQGAFYGVVGGAIKASSLRPDGKEAILAVLEAGNWFGEISLIDRQPRTHDATAMGTLLIEPPREHETQSGGQRDAGHHRCRQHGVHDVRC